MTQTIMVGGRESSRTIWVGWEPPRQEWISLNTDGCFKEATESDGSGGILSDHKANWICGFSMKMGIV